MLIEDGTEQIFKLNCYTLAKTETIKHIEFWKLEFEPLENFSLNSCNFDSNNFQIQYDRNLLEQEQLRIFNLNEEEKEPIHNLRLQFSGTFYLERDIFSFTNDVRYLSDTYKAKPIYIKSYKCLKI